MRVTVTFCDAALTLAAVRIQPNWIERLCGLRDFDDLARISDYGSWVWDSPFARPIASRRIVDAIELARRRCLSGPVTAV